MPDGTTFDFPGHDAGPPPFDVPADSKNEIRLRIKLESKRADKSHLDDSQSLKIIEEEEGGKQFG